MVEIIVTENGNVRGVFTRVISASLTDSLNGECTFQFSVISSMASEIFTGLEVQLKSDTLNYLFNVVKVSKSLSGGIAICAVECEHKSYELNNDEYKLTEFDFEGAPGECLISLLQGTSLTAGICDQTVPIKLKINRECTRRAALMQLIALCGGEIEYNGTEINIRSHRGSQDYIGIMDGRNVSDLTMETDSRSGTTNYGLTLYKNMNFSVGDNVQIVFHPFNLNVNTRISHLSAFDLQGYQVVRNQFTQVRYEGPSLTISEEKITFNLFCMKKFDDVGFVQLLLHPTERKIAIRPCQETDVHSIRWRPDPTKQFYSKTLLCQHFGNALYNIMKWNPDFLYKIRGIWAKRLNEQIIVFNLTNAMPAVLVTKDGTENAVKQRVEFCPDEWTDDFGEEFYEHTLENGFYYLTPDSDWQTKTQSIPAPGIEQYLIPSAEELQQSMATIKKGTDDKNE